MVGPLYRSTGADLKYKYKVTIRYQCSKWENLSDLYTFYGNLHAHGWLVCDLAPFNALQSYALHESLNFWGGSLGQFKLEISGLISYAKFCV